MAFEPGPTDTAELLLAMAVEITELRQQLAEVQNHLVEIAVDNGLLHERIEGLQAELAEARSERDAQRLRSFEADKRQAAA